MPRSAAQQVLSKRREAECLELRLEGCTFDEIAKKLGYANRSGAKKAYHRSLERIGQDTAGEALGLQFDRLNALLYAIWPHVEKGSLPAIRQALDVIDRIDHLFGFAQRPIQRESA
jgi:hypothetical protein